MYKPVSAKNNSGLTPQIFKRLSMYIPNTPTDNLYKFLALAGLALFALSVIVPVSDYRSVLRRSVELYGELNLVEAELKYVESDVVQMRRRRGLSDDATRVLEDDFAADCESQDPSAGTPKISCAEAQALKDKVKEVRILHERSRTQLALLKDLKNETTTLAFLAVAGVVGGLLVAIIGFTLWYSRLQKHQDRIIAKEAKSAEESSESATQV